MKNDIPEWWLEFVSKYDKTYDYLKLKKSRDNLFISLKELEKAKIRK